MTDLRLRPRKSKKRLLLLTSSIALVLLLLLGFLGKSTLRGIIDQIQGVEYSGAGVGTTAFLIERGDTGEDVARKLVKEGITKEVASTLRHIYAANPTFFPGTYNLPKQISSDDAISRLTNPANMIVNRVTIREGLRIKKVFKELSDKTGIPVSEFTQAATNLKDFDLPSAAPSLEGYLFPATYDLDPNFSAKDILSAMVTRTKEELTSFGVPRSKWHRVLTLASVIQVEARQTQDLYKVSRVFLNRIDKGMYLQSDATVSYGVDGNTVSTSNADRANTNGYNTYVHLGLPIGPISAPGNTAIDAALHPADGSWLYFCAVNLATGETVFSDTYAQHEKAVAQWRSWMRENPGWNG